MENCSHVRVSEWVSPDERKTKLLTWVQKKVEENEATDECDQTTAEEHEILTRRREK